MHTDETLERPLRGLRVVEFEGIGPDPLAGRMLSDMGAHVTVVARPTISPVDRALIGEDTENLLRQGKEIVVLSARIGHGSRNNIAVSRPGRTREMTLLLLLAFAG